MESVELIKLANKPEMSGSDFDKMVELLVRSSEGVIATDDLLALYAETVDASRFAAKDRAAPDCRQCGACCAYFQQIPVLIVDATPRALTWAVWDDGDRDGERLRWLRREPVAGRCVALDGRVGERVSCSIYELRPQACREFEAGSDRCYALRRMYGIEPELEAGERAAHALLLKADVSSQTEELQDDELWPSDEAARIALMRELIEYNTAKLEDIIAEMKRLADCLARHKSKRGEALCLAALAAVESIARALDASGDDLLGIGIASQHALEQASEELAELGQVAFEMLEMRVCADKSTA